MKVSPSFNCKRRKPPGLITRQSPRQQSEDNKRQHALRRHNLTTTPYANSSSCSVHDRLAVLNHRHRSQRIERTVDHTVDKIASRSMSPAHVPPFHTHTYDASDVAQLQSHAQQNVNDRDLGDATDNVDVKHADPDDAEHTYALIDAVEWMRSDDQILQLLSLPQKRTNLHAVLQSMSENEKQQHLNTSFSMQYMHLLRLRLNADVLFNLLVSENESNNSVVLKKKKTIMVQLQSIFSYHIYANEMLQKPIAANIKQKMVTDWQHALFKAIAYDLYFENVCCPNRYGMDYSLSRLSKLEWHKLNYFMLSRHVEIRKCTLSCIGVGADHNPDLYYQTACAMKGMNFNAKFTMVELYFDPLLTVYSSQSKSKISILHLLHDSSQPVLHLDELIAEFQLLIAAEKTDRTRVAHCEEFENKKQALIQLLACNTDTIMKFRYRQSNRNRFCLLLLLLRQLDSRIV